MSYRCGLDIGSTTVKLLVLDDADTLIFSDYQRHFADVETALGTMLAALGAALGADAALRVGISGSGAMGLAPQLGLPFVQEVIACTRAVEALIPQADVVVELGGEDSKLTFMTGGLEQRMNSSCAGGTGAFIDQMATLLDTDAAGLNQLAKDAQILYPIASRCGVFAKSDVQPLLNQGAQRTDIAASILQAVVNQTIAGLSAGRRIEGNVAFLGGPLSFLDELRAHFVQTLQLAPNQVVFPPDSLYFVAYGAALSFEDAAEVAPRELLERLNAWSTTRRPATDTLPPLFASPEDLERFQERHAQVALTAKPLAQHVGPVFLGIDAGSTTLKLVVLDEGANLLYSHYANNGGQPLEAALQALDALYAELPAAAYIGRAVVTGYGEQLLKDALGIDAGEVETMAHYRAANHFLPGVDFILDIGGQDMKALRMKEGQLASVLLNEACSSGCGSFIEGFARSLGYAHVRDFAQEALRATAPSNLGSKCTVFMNSKVKQLQKEGASVSDIAAGLAYSVVKNSLYKVIKLHSPAELGEKVVVQGGTFLNDAVLRALELISGREVVRPPIAGLMGAYGAALLATEDYQPSQRSTLLPRQALATFTVRKETSHCGLCENNCLLTTSIFPDGWRSTSGNRCERGARGVRDAARDEHGASRGAGVSGTAAAPPQESVVNLVDYKYRRLFGAPSLKPADAPRGVVGLPRVLNMYENYPFWHALLTGLGFRVELSPRSSKRLYEQGMHTIPGDSICYPAKLCHGHIQALVDKGVPLIFFPTVMFERPEFEAMDNHALCIIIQGYPVALRNNIDALRDGTVDYRCPTFDLSDAEQVVADVHAAFADLGVSEQEARRAVTLGFEAADAAKADIQQKGRETLALLAEKDAHGIVLAGYPYHVDPEINHGIAGILEHEGFHILTEDSIAHLGDVKDLRVNNVWVYQARLYAAAKVVARNPRLELIQLNSFGCGSDSVSVEQVEELLNQYGKQATVLKIDEIANLGAARIRVRSLKAALQARQKAGITPQKRFEAPTAAPFTVDMIASHTLIIPAMIPIREKGLLDVALGAAGYNTVYLDFEPRASELGLQYMNNDYCFTLFDYVGQIIGALRGGSYDLAKTSVMMMDSCSMSCRGCGFLPVVRKALDDAGFAQVPLVPYQFMYGHVEKPDEGALQLNTKGGGLKLDAKAVRGVNLANSYGEVFERVVFRTRPYEVESGQIDALHDYWIKRARPSIINGSLEEFNTTVKELIKAFDEVELLDIEKPRIGLIGDPEIPIDFSLVGVNNFSRLLEAEGAEVVLGNTSNLGTSNYRAMGEFQQAEEYFNLVDNAVNEALEASQRFFGLSSILESSRIADQTAPFANYRENYQFAMGGTMLTLLKHGVYNIVNFVSFNCQLNYVVGSSFYREYKRQFPQANIVEIEYLPGLPAVNQLNRIRLLLAHA